MKIDAANLELACYELARTIRWKKDPVDEVLAKAMVQGYLQIAMQHEQYLLDMGRDPNILVRAVRYLSHAHAIPPLEGNMEWFRSALDVLIEMSCPNSVFGKEHEQFLKDIEQGLAEIRENYAG